MGENIFANYASDKGFYIKIDTIKRSYNSHKKKSNDSKMGKGRK